MRIVKSESHDAACNCELEKRLLTETADEILLFYINSPSVVVGRNQSIEAEADTEYCLWHGIAIVRRISGGGAVYHDEGNINYAFIGNKGEKLLLDNDLLRPIIDALADFGVRATEGKRRELLVDGLKISGTASYATKGRQLFHGTILHNTGLSAMRHALRGDASKRGKRIASVPSAVMNLNTLPGLDIPTGEFLEKLICFFEGYYGCKLDRIF